MRVLDLFSGLEGWSQPFRDRGHEVTTLDYEPKFGADIQEDIMSWDPLTIDPPDLVLASPDCTMFSHGGWHQRAWRMVTKGEDYRALNLRAMKSLDLVRRTVDLVRMWDCPFVIENPMGLLRVLDIIPAPRQEIWYCHYGEDRAKPTDLWTNMPLTFRQRCHNQHRSHAADCCCRDHVAAVRGSTTGTQGLSAAEAGKIPYELAQSVCLFAESYVYEGSISARS